MGIKKTVVVIGGGPAGIMAAGFSASKENRVILLEKNLDLGKKLSICGKGRCNITNDTDIDGLMANTPGNGKFLYSAFSRFSNRDIIEFFNSIGLRTKVERGGRVFPVSDNAKDVVNVLKKYLNSKNVIVKYNKKVLGVEVIDRKVSGVKLDKGEVIKCDSVIIATGGKSYKATGSTGDGYKWALDLGHTVVPIKPSLVPLEVRDSFIKKLQGLSLKNVSIILKDSKGKEVYKDFGEMLFTHFGVSGPIILSASRHILKYDYKNIKLIIDLKPALSDEKLDKRLQRDFLRYSNKQLKNALVDILPQKLIPVIITLAGILEDRVVNSITKKERERLAYCMKNLSCEICGSRPINEAIVTAGGVSTKEINPKDMQSKLIEGLYFAGEIIDVDAYTGGFNLTIAFSTGYLAGISQL